MVNLLGHYVSYSLLSTQTLTMYMILVYIRKSGHAHDSIKYDKQSIQWPNLKVPQLRRKLLGTFKMEL